MVWGTVYNKSPLARLVLLLLQSNSFLFPETVRRSFFNLYARPVVYKFRGKASGKIGIGSGWRTWGAGGVGDTDRTCESRSGPTPSLASKQQPPIPAMLSLLNEPCRRFGRRKQAGTKEPSSPHVSISFLMVYEAQGVVRKSGVTACVLVEWRILGQQIDCLISTTRF